MTSEEDDYESRENLWDEAWPTTENNAAGHPDEETDSDDELSPFPEAVGTTDSDVSIRDAEPYMAPTDPPVVPGGNQGVTVATGFGQSPDEEMADEPLPRGDEDIRDEALTILRSDSLASTLPLDVDVRNGVIHLRGRTSSPDEVEHIMWTLGELPGVEDVVDDTELATNVNAG